MENDSMGKVLVSTKIANLNDLVLAANSTLPPDRVRSVDVADAVVDTGATTLMIPKRFITQLGLKPLRTRRARTTAGTVILQMYDAVRLTVQERECTVDVAEISDDCPVLLGQVPLELLDFVVDPSGQRLIGNPAHGGEQMIELFLH